MKNDKQQSSFVNIGSSSLLIIFLILCLATFAILSVSSAKNDYSFSEKLAARKTQYYGASAKASLILDEIDTRLSELAGANLADDMDAYMDQVISMFYETQIDDIDLDCRPFNDTVFISYRIPVGEQQELSVRLRVTDYTANDTYYEIQEWRILSNDEWEGGQTLNLMPVNE